MGFPMELQEMIVFGFVFAIICLWLVNEREKKKKKGKSPPVPSGAWPVIGHLHLLAADNPYRVFGAMADKHGPVLLIRLGQSQAVVISSWEMAKECFTTNDKAFSNRPRSLALKLMGYDHAMFSLAPYGPYWREARKISVLKLLSPNRLEVLKHGWESEINVFIKGLYKEWVENGGRPVVVEMKQRFGDLGVNIIGMAVAGKRYFGAEACDNKSRRCQKAFNKFLQLAGLFMVTDAVPFLGWFDTVRGYTAEMKRTAREVDDIVRCWVEEHRQAWLSGRIDEAEQDFIHVLLSVVDAGQFPGCDPEIVIKSTVLAIILGGYDSPYLTFVWAVSLLLNNQETLKKAQQELDIHVGKHRQVEESDIKNLVYLQAIVKETLRLYPPAPLSAPREAIEDCSIAGFHIKAGTRLLVNLWKLHRDPRIWSDPLEFQPERFLTDNVHLDVRGRSFEILPFGAGRRICPGITFSMRSMHLTLARLLHGFELGRASDSPVDMSEGLGLTMPKLTPLEVIIAPRLASELYGL